jgi:hypothetical protein
MYGCQDVLCIIVVCVTVLASVKGTCLNAGATELVRQQKRAIVQALPQVGR